MAYRVSMHEDGGKRWWQESDEIPLIGRLSTTLNIRTATMAEEEIMDEIVAQDAAGQMPDATLGDRICTLMAQTY